MKVKIVLLDEELIISVNSGSIDLFNNRGAVTVRFESEENLKQIIKAHKEAVVFVNVDIKDLEAKLVEIADIALARSDKEKLKGTEKQKQEPMLSNREKEILALLANGLTKRQMAEKLSLSFHTIDSHLRNIYKKLNVNSKPQAITRAFNEGIL